MTIINRAAAITTKTARKPWFSRLWLQVLIAMAVGIWVGWRFPDIGVAMQPLGDAFIKTVRMLIAPLIFCTVVHGIAQMADVARVGRVAIKALIYFEIMTTIALIIGMIMLNLFQPGAGMNVDLSQINTSLIEPYVKQTASVGFVPFLLGVIPATFIGAFADGNILQVLFISVLCGFAVMWLGPAGRPLVDLAGASSQMIFGVVAIVMRAAPLGAFGAIAFTLGKFGIGSLASLGKLLIVFYSTCLIFVFGVLGPVAALCRFNLLKLMRFLWEEILLCIATTSSETVMPQLIKKMETLGCEESVAGLVIPSGYSFNLDGTCLYLVSTALFLAQATNTTFPLEQQISLILILLITSKGAAGVAGAAFVVLTATLAAQQTIPVTSVAIVLGIHRLLSQGMTPTNFIGNAVATIVVAKWENSLDSGKLRNVLGQPSVNASGGL